MSAAQGTERPRIVVGVDGSTNSMDAVKWGARQAELMGAELELIAAWSWPNIYGDVPLPSNYDPAADAGHILDDAEQTVRKEHPGVAFRRMAIQGHAAAILVEASRGAALLVVGSRGRGSFVGMVLGSVSQHCVTNAMCPVLVLRSE